MPEVNVEINGRKYRMACEAGQEKHLIGLAQRFDAHVEQLKGAVGEIGDNRLTVMAGIAVVDELAEIGVSRRDAPVVALGIRVVPRFSLVPHRLCQFEQGVVLGIQRHETGKHDAEFAGIPDPVERMQRPALHAADAMAMHGDVSHDKPLLMVQPLVIPLWK